MKKYIIANEKKCRQKIKSLDQRHRHSWSEQGKETGSPVKADIYFPPSKQSFIWKSGVLLLPPFFALSLALQVFILV